MTGRKSLDTPLMWKCRANQFARKEAKAQKLASQCDKLNYKIYIRGLWQSEQVLVWTALELVVEVLLRCQEQHVERTCLSHLPEL